MVTIVYYYRRFSYQDAFKSLYSVDIFAKYINYEFETRLTVPKYVASPMDRILLTSRLINPILLTDSLSNRSQSIGQQFNRLVSIVISKDA